MSNIKIAAILVLFWIIAGKTISLWIRRLRVFLESLPGGIAPSKKRPITNTGLTRILFGANPICPLCGERLREYRESDITPGLFPQYECEACGYTYSKVFDRREKKVYG